MTQFCREAVERRGLRWRPEWLEFLHAGDPPERDAAEDAREAARLREADAVGRAMEAETKAGCDAQKADLERERAAMPDPPPPAVARRLKKIEDQLSTEVIDDDESE